MQKKEKKMHIIVKLHTNEQGEFNCKTIHNSFLVYLSVRMTFY